MDLFARSSNTRYAFGAAVLFLACAGAGCVSTSSGGDAGMPPEPTPPDGSSADPSAPPRSSARIYWVGHSLISHTDSHAPESKNLAGVVEALVASRGDGYSDYHHNVVGAPLGWNWGNPDAAWNDGVSELILPLVSSTHADYGTFDTIVITEGVAIQSSYESWASGFYARRFFCAARRANPSTELYLYESWGHLQRTDPDFTSIYEAELYNPGGSWDFLVYQRDSRAVWNAIADEAADPALTPAVDDYTPWRLGDDDPGDCDETLEVKIIPTGQALANLIERIAEDRSTDDWTYAEAAVGGRLSAVDLMDNPYVDFPANTTTAHGGTVDDIHPSHVLVYLNALVHTSVLYRKDPSDLPAANGVPENIASILREIAWQTVLEDPRTGLQ